jgi:hypothetical protein
MSFYEVVVAVVRNGREMGRTVVQLPARSRFDAAVKAESSIDERYGEGTYGKFVKVGSITNEEFLTLAVA